MKLSRVLSLSVILTSFSLLYVWQQTEIVRFAYLGQRNQIIFQDSLDKNSSLRYNLKRSTSLIYIGNKVFGCSDFQMPETYCLLKLVSPTKSAETVKQTQTKKFSLAYRLFGIKREAEAKTIGSPLSTLPNDAEYFQGH